LSHINRTISPYGKHAWLPACLVTTTKMDRVVMTSDRTRPDRHNDNDILDNTYSSSLMKVEHRTVIGSEPISAYELSDPQRETGCLVVIIVQTNLQ